MEQRRRNIIYKFCVYEQRLRILPCCQFSIGCPETEHAAH